MGSLRGGWHSCPTNLELAAGFTGAFLAGVALGVLGTVLVRGGRP